MRAVADVADAKVVHLQAAERVRFTTSPARSLVDAKFWKDTRGDGEKMAITYFHSGYYRYCVYVMVHNCAFSSPITHKVSLKI